jgi:anti-sigma B factor antagonist
LVRLEGDLDLSCQLPVRQAIDEASLVLGDWAPCVIVDMSAVHFIDSAGLSTIIHAGKWISVRGGRFVLIGLQPRVRKILEITRTLPMFESYQTLEDFTAEREPPPGPDGH